MLLLEIKTFCFSRFVWKLYISKRRVDLSRAAHISSSHRSRDCWGNSKCLHIRQFYVHRHIQTHKHTNTQFTSTHDRTCFVFFSLSTVVSPFSCMPFVFRYYFVVYFSFSSVLIKFCWWQHFLWENDFYSRHIQ